MLKDFVQGKNVLKDFVQGKNVLEDCFFQGKNALKVFFSIVFPQTKTGSADHQAWSAQGARRINVILHVRSPTELET